jgi:hypothetical protein
MIKQGKGSVRSFRETIRSDLLSQVENQRWEILLRQKRVIEEYAEVAELLRKSDVQVSRLLGLPPSEKLCPHCHYLSGIEVSLIPVADENRAGSDIMTCPSCKLVLPP